MIVRYCFYSGYNRIKAQQQKNKKARLTAEGRYIDPLHSIWLNYSLKNR